MYKPTAVPKMEAMSLLEFATLPALRIWRRPVKKVQKPKATGKTVNIHEQGISFAFALTVRKIWTRQCHASIISFRFKIVMKHITTVTAILNLIVAISSWDPP